MEEEIAQGLRNARIKTHTYHARAGRSNTRRNGALGPLEDDGLSQGVQLHAAIASLYGRHECSTHIRGSARS